MTSASYAARSRYAEASVTTASPARLLIMLYDRLLRDLTRAEEAVRGRDVATAAAELLHAQEIVLELNASLDTDAWSGAAGLSALYVFLHKELVQANIRKDADRIAACRELVEPLRDAWREAALQAATTA